MVKKICEVCKGNGFVRVPYELTREEVWANCDFCKSQGEVEIKEETNGQSGNPGPNETN
jgi:DnaJ-class molecular chaperone